MKLYSGPHSMFGMKAHIAALEKNISIEVIQVAFSNEKAYYPKHPEVVRVNPKKQVPVLLDDDLEIFDSSQIFEYFEDIKPSPNLWPIDHKKRAKARLLELKADEVFFPPVVRLMLLQDQLQSEEALAAIKEIQNYYLDMEALLKDSDYLVNEFSYADVAFFMAQIFAERMGAPITSATPKLIEWRDGMLARDSVQQAIMPMLEFSTRTGRFIPEVLNKYNPYKRVSKS